MKFLDNTNNKSEIIHLLSSVVQKNLQITVELCNNNDSDTSTTRTALAAKDDFPKEDILQICYSCFDDKNYLKLYHFLWSWANFRSSTARLLEFSGSLTK